MLPLLVAGMAIPRSARAERRQGGNGVYVAGVFKRTGPGPDLDRPPMRAGICDPDTVTEHSGQKAGGPGPGAVGWRLAEHVAFLCQAGSLLSIANRRKRGYCNTTTGSAWRARLAGRIIMQRKKIVNAAIKVHTGELMRLSEQVAALRVKRKKHAQRVKRLRGVLRRLSERVAEPQA